MVDNKSKTSLIRHIQKKYITHKDKQYALVSYIVIFIRDIFFCICYWGSFPIVVISTFHTDIMTHTSNTSSLGLTTYQLNIQKISN